MHKSVSLNTYVNMDVCVCACIRLDTCLTWSTDQLEKDHCWMKRRTLQDEITAHMMSRDSQVAARNQDMMRFLMSLFWASELGDNHALMFWSLRGSDVSFGPWALLGLSCGFLTVAEVEYCQGFEVQRKGLH